MKWVPPTGRYTTKKTVVTKIMKHFMIDISFYFTVKRRQNRPLKCWYPTEVQEVTTQKTWTESKATKVQWPVHFKKHCSHTGKYIAWGMSWDRFPLTIFWLPTQNPLLRVRSLPGSKHQSVSKFSATLSSDSLRITINTFAMSVDRQPCDLHCVLLAVFANTGS